MKKRNSGKDLGQKAKRSTSRPRAGMQHRKQPGVAGAKVGSTPDNPLILHEGDPVPPGVRYVQLVGDLMPSEDVGPEKHRDRAHRWSITYPSREALFKDRPSERRPGTLEEFHPAALEQFEAARQTAMKILDTGVVGESECVTTISGHANKHHQPTNGQPNDRLSISIQQKGS